MTILAVTADDRSGALETAAACLSANVTVAVVQPWGCAEAVSWEAAQVVVVDIESRHIAAAEAAERAAGADVVGASRIAHKIDSGLRGNWASELVGRQGVGIRRVLVVPALPGMGRVCDGGVVFHNAVPVSSGPAGQDVRTPVRLDRPADHLVQVGVAVSTITQCTPADVGAWLASDSAGIAVCDASTDHDLERVAQTWLAHPDVLLAGTSAVIGAGVHALRPRSTASSWMALPRPMLVVVGSVHPMALTQVAALAAMGVTAVASNVPTDATISPALAKQVLANLAQKVRLRMTTEEFATVVVIGGDTAAALQGTDHLQVLGLAAPGTPVSRHVRADGPLWVTRAGGFGDPDSLVRLVTGKMES